MPYRDVTQGCNIGVPYWGPYGGAILGCPIRIQYRGAIQGCSIGMQSWGAIWGSLWGCPIRMQYRGLIQGVQYWGPYGGSL